MAKYKDRFQVGTYPLPGTGGETWPMTNDTQAVEQFLLDERMPTCAPVQDEFWRSLGPEYPRGPTGLYGLAAAAAAAEKVSIPQAQPIKTSTIYLVAGAAALLVVGSIAFYAWKAGNK